jgi:DNA primase
MLLQNFQLMEISEIKQRLSIIAVLSHYGLKPDRNKRINCPFHDDKTPSMQVYPETGTVFCFSSNCSLNGKAIDQIDFIMHKESCSKHEAIEKAKSLLNYAAPISGQKHPAPPEPVVSEAEGNTKILSKIFNYFRNGFIMRKDNKARNYLQGRKLDVSKLENLGITFGWVKRFKMCH